MTLRCYTAHEDETPSNQGVSRCADMFDRLEATEQRYEDLTSELARPEISGDYAKLQTLGIHF